MDLHLHLRVFYMRHGVTRTLGVTARAWILAGALPSKACWSVEILVFKACGKGASNSRPTGIERQPHEKLKFRVTRGKSPVDDHASASETLAHILKFQWAGRTAGARKKTPGTAHALGAPRSGGGEPFMIAVDRRAAAHTNFSGMTPSIRYPQ